MTANCIRMREVIVPPEKRIINVKCAVAAEYKPGEKATVKVKLTGIDGNRSWARRSCRFMTRAWSTLLEASNVPEIKEYFWKCDGIISRRRNRR